MKAYYRQPITLIHNNGIASTNVDLEIARIFPTVTNDIHWLDFNDSTFKGSAWADKDGDCTEDDDNLWFYEWTIPDEFATYQIYFIDVDKTRRFNGPIVEVYGGIFFTVEDTPTPTASVFDTDLPYTVDDYLKAPSLVKMLTGNTKGQTAKLPASGSYDGSTDVGKITLQAGLSQAPAIGDQGIIITE